MEEERQRQRDFLNMQNQINQGKDLLSRERQELANIRKTFLEEMDSRVKQRLEDWETNSQKKNGKISHSPQAGNPNEKRSSTFTYTYTDVSIYDKGIQTEMRRSKIKDMNVQVGIGSR